MLLSLDSLCSEVKDNGGGGNGHGGSSEGSSGSEDFGTPGDGNVRIRQSHVDSDWVGFIVGGLGGGGHETSVGWVLFEEFIHLNAKSLATEAALKLIEVIVCSALSNTRLVTFELAEGFFLLLRKFEVLVQFDLGTFWIVFPDIWIIIRGSHELFLKGFVVENKSVTDLAVQFNN